MRFLRQVSTRRLLVLCAAAVVLVVCVTAIALAATGGGPKPPPKPLARAIHDALAGSRVDGVSARIQFSNHLVGQPNIGEAGNPLITGASGRAWASNDGRVRIELQTDRGTGDSQVLLDRDRFTIFDAGSNTVYRGELPGGRDHGAGTHKVPTVAQIQRRLTQLMRHANVSDAQPSDVAGRAAYTVQITPKRDGGLVGGVQLAWDAANGVPLRAAVYAAGSSSPVLELRATHISFGKVDSSVFDIHPPADAKVVDLGTPAGNGAKPVQGLKAVRARVSFPVSAPRTLAGLPRTAVRLGQSDRDAAAVIGYGRGLGGILVVESPAREQGNSSLGDVKLQSVAIGPAIGHELSTALGTVLTFDRGGVSYLVAGSKQPAAVEAAARGL